MDRNQFNRRLYGYPVPVTLLAWVITIIFIALVITIIVFGIQNHVIVQKQVLSIAPAILATYLIYISIAVRLSDLPPGKDLHTDSE